MGGAVTLRTVALGMMFLVTLGCGRHSDNHPGTPDAATSGTIEDASEPEPDAGSPADAAAPNDAGAAACRSIVCRAPAVCVSLGDPHCSCPSGYDDPNHDASRCTDRNECNDSHNGGCDAHADCINTPGSVRCECQGPAYVGNGKQCDCGQGYTRDSEGNCLASDGLHCGDNLDCMNGHCVGGTCCGQSCGDPSECQTTEGASCADGSTCTYPLAIDGSECDDLKACTAISTCQKGVCTSGAEPTNCDDANPCTDDSCVEPIGCKNRNNSISCNDHNACTQNDQCQTGGCMGTPLDCSSNDDVCNLGECDPRNGTCIKKPKAATTTCDDHNSCTSSALCNAGACVGSGDACGSQALTCTTGTPNTCTCAAGFRDNMLGRCVPMNDECANASRCPVDANCNDPSNADGDAVCSCKPGYAGDGAGCTAVDPCKNNPCGAGRGSCVPGTDGTHSCACAIGYVAAGDTCVCDMTGTFATRTRLEARWPTLATIEGGQDSTYSYAIERHSYDSRGNLMLELTACGETSLDACGVGVSPVLAAEAYSTFLPIDIWNMPSMPVVRTKLSVPNALPGAAFTTDLVASLVGISLEDPLGDWPLRRADIAGTPWFDGTAVNGATWRDQDNDTFVGITSYAVPPGGIKADGMPPDPMKDFGANSAVCPRSGGNHSKYEYWPAPAEGFSLTPIRVKRFYTASRVISSLSGKLNSCDDIAGDVIGPDDGKPQFEGRTGGCVRTVGAGEANCSSDTVDFLDSQIPENSGQEIVSVTFRTKRVASPVTCTMARGLNYDD